MYDKCIEMYKSCLKYSFDDSKMKAIYMHLGSAYFIIVYYSDYYDLLEKL